MVGAISITRLDSKSVQESISIIPYCDNVYEIIKRYINDFHPNAFGIYHLLYEEIQEIESDIKFKKETFVFIANKLIYILDHKNRVAAGVYPKTLNSDFKFIFEVLNVEAEPGNYLMVNKKIDDAISKYNLNGSCIDIKFTVDTINTTITSNVKIASSVKEKEEIPESFKSDVDKEKEKLDYFLSFIMSNGENWDPLLKVKLLQNPIVTTKDPEIVAFKQIGDHIVLTLEYNINNYPVLTNLLLDLDYMGLYIVDSSTETIKDVLPCRAEPNKKEELIGYHFGEPDIVDDFDGDMDIKDQLSDMFDGDKISEYRLDEDETSKRLSEREDRSTNVLVYEIFTGSIYYASRYDIKNRKDDELVDLKIMLIPKRSICLGLPSNYKIERKKIGTMVEKIAGNKSIEFILLNYISD